MEQQCFPSNISIQQTAIALTLFNCALLEDEQNYTLHVNVHVLVYVYCSYNVQGRRQRGAEMIFTISYGLYYYHIWQKLIVNIIPPLVYGPDVHACMYVYKAIANIQCSETPVQYIYVINLFLLSLPPWCMVEMSVAHCSGKDLFYATHAVNHMPCRLWYSKQWLKPLSHHDSQRNINQHTTLQSTPITWTYMYMYMKPTCTCTTVSSILSKLAAWEALCI